VTDAIVVTYRSRDAIEACLEPLVAAGLHVVVVDNAETADVVRDKFPQVELIANEENVGFPAAVNQGLARCTGDVVLLVNPDCVVPPETVEALVAYVREHPDVGVAAPRLREPDGSINVSAHPIATFGTLLANRLRRFFPVLTPLLARDERWASYDACLHATEPTDVEMAIAACVAVRSSFLRELGGLDEGYFMYCEDMELCLQSWRRGLRVVYLPGVEAFHEGGGSSGDRSHVWPLHTRSTLRFHARNRPRTFQLVRLALIARAAVGLVDPRAHRRRAWSRVARIALTVPRRTLLS
jgi:GT2 family glycosyltransferase